MFNKFLYQNKFVIEKHIKFIIETNTHIKFIEIYIYMNTMQGCTYEKSYKKINIQKNILIYKKINKKPQMNHNYHSKN